MPKFTTFKGYTNIFEDGEGRRYPSGIVHTTAEAALAARTKVTKGQPIGVAEIIWDEPENASWLPWTAKS